MRIRIRNTVFKTYLRILCSESVVKRLSPATTGRICAVADMLPDQVGDAQVPNVSVAFEVLIYSQLIQNSFSFSLFY